MHLIIGSNEKKVVKGVPLPPAWYRVERWQCLDEKSKGRFIDRTNMREWEFIRAADVELDWAACEPFGVLFDGPSLSNSSIWVKVTKFPCYLKVVV